MEITDKLVSFLHIVYMRLLLLILLMNTAYSSEVMIAIIDTGIQIDDKSHLLSSTMRTAVAGDYGLDTSSNRIDNTPLDINGHGTHISGIIHSINKDAKLLIIRFFQDCENLSDHRIAFKKALKFAIDSKVDLINYSGGFESFDQEEYELIKSSSIPLIVAAGNFGSDLKDNPFYPASYDLDNIITVGAIDSNSNILDLSNFGAEVDIFAPGKDIISDGIYQELKKMTGTSQATAMVTGVMSLFIQYRKSD